MEFVRMLRKAAEDKADLHNSNPLNVHAEEMKPEGTLYWDAANEIVMLHRALEYAYRVVNYGFEYGSFDMSVLRREAKAYFEKFPEGQV